MENDENQDIALDNNEEIEVTEETTETEPVEEDTTDWKAEALKFKAIAERQKRKVTTTNITRKEDSDLKPLKDSVDELLQEKRKREFGYEHNLSPEATDAIFRFNPNPTKEDLDNPFVKAGVEALKAKKRVESSTPSPSSHSPKFEGKSFEELDPEQKAANYEKLVQAKLNARKR